MGEGTRQEDRVELRLRSFAAEPDGAQVLRLRAVVDSGAVSPLIPLASPLLLRCSPESLDRTGRIVLAAAASLLPELLDAPFAKAAHDSPTMASPVHLGPRVRRVVAHELGTGRRLGFTRLDVVCPIDAPERFALLEIQAGDPSAMGWHDALASAFLERPVLMEAHRRLMETMTPRRRIAFVVPRGSIVESDHRLLTAHYAANGWEASCVDPRSLVFRGGALHAAGRPVDVVFRDALDELFCGDFTEGGEALLAALEDEAVVLMNPLCAALADDKRLLEPLSSRERWPAEVADVLSAHVPWTRVVYERRVVWNDEAIDLAALLRREREHLVLKPAEGFGGFGVIVGPHVSPELWGATVDNALRHPGTFVAQRALSLPRQPVYLLGPRAIERRERYVVHSLWFAPHLVGAYARAADAPVVNVHQGGGLAPTFFLGGETDLTSAPGGPRNGVRPDRGVY